MEKLVSAAWLSDHLDDAALVILDASMHLPDAKRDARAEFAEGHIPGTRFLDLASLNDESDPAPKAVPSAEQLAARLSALGVEPSHRIVLYDDSAIRTSARAWFVLNLYGIESVAILDGGLAAWKADGGAMESGEIDAVPSHFPASALARNDSMLRDKGDVRRNLTEKDEQLVDARSKERFEANGADAVHGGQAGHIPGSRNLPFSSLFDEQGRYRDKDELRRAFEQAGLDLSEPIITSCGSGVTASTLFFALDRLGHDKVALYDGSWLDWGSDPATPKETGPAR